MKRVILHVDMDAFYASVEQKDRPELRGRPVIVGGTTNRGVVSAASYEARRFGIHSAMPIFEARRKCPDGIFLPVRMGRYKEVSWKIMTLLEGYSPLVEQVSIDEAFVDISGLDRLHGSSKEVASKIKLNIGLATFLNCSVGVAPGKVFAKIASDMNKPDGLTLIEPQDLSRVIQNLPINKVPGV
ncbi:MAG: DNA polymerase IV, partial [Desulfobacterales bacterium]|nr:DNA polymerase IV [Desulfobacterales bacterium]